MKLPWLRYDKEKERVAELKRGIEEAQKSLDEFMQEIGPLNDELKCGLPFDLCFVRSF